jgi:hypothetical protein
MLNFVGHYCFVFGLNPPQIEHPLPCEAYSRFPNAGEFIHAPSELFAININQLSRQ